MWLISYVLLKKKYQSQVFWIVTVLSAFAFAAGHLPSIMMLYEVTDPGAMPAPLLSEILILNGILSVFAVWGMRKFGFLAAVGIHFWADIVWHVIWPVF